MFTKSKKIVSLILCLIMMLSSIPSNAFNDIQNHWGEVLIEDFVAKGYINGRDSTWFDPDAPISRAEFTVILLRIFQQDSIKRKV